MDGSRCAGVGTHDMSAAVICAFRSSFITVFLSRAVRFTPRGAVFPTIKTTTTTASFCTASKRKYFSVSYVYLKLSVCFVRWHFFVVALMK